MSPKVRSKGLRSAGVAVHIRLLAQRGQSGYSIPADPGTVVTLQTFQNAQNVWDVTGDISRAGVGLVKSRHV